MRHRNTFALKITVGRRCACLSRQTVASNNTQANSRIDTKTTNIGCASEFTRLTRATVFHNLCRDHHEITSFSKSQYIIVIYTKCHTMPNIMSLITRSLALKLF